MPYNEAVKEIKKLGRDNTVSPSFFLSKLQQSLKELNLPGGRRQGGVIKALLALGPLQLWAALKRQHYQICHLGYGAFFLGGTWSLRHNRVQSIMDLGFRIYCRPGALKEDSKKERRLPFCLVPHSRIGNYIKNQLMHYFRCICFQVIKRDDD